MNKITLIYENNQYYLQIVNAVNDTVITRIIMTNAVRFTSKFRRLIWVLVRIKK